MHELTSINSRTKNLEVMILKLMDSDVLSGQDKNVRQSYLKELRKPEGEIAITSKVLGQGGFEKAPK